MRRGQPALHRLTGVPVLLVGDVPEVHRVARVEPRRVHRLGREGPGALDPGPVRGQRGEPVRHHVVRVQAEQDVGEDLDVDDGPQPLGVQVPQRHPVAGAVQRHGGHAVAQVHPAADPGPGGRVVLAALGRADLAQLGVDLRAVVALVVVLGQDLPVGRDLVVVLAAHHEPAQFVGGDQLVQTSQGVGQRPGSSGSINENQPVPLLHREFDEAPGVGVEAGPVLEARGGAQVPFQAVGPRVVRADDDAGLRGGAAGQQLVPAVAAEVGERAQRAVVAADDEHAALADRLGPHVPGGRGLGTASHAHPAAAEEVLPLPGEHVRAHVGGAGQHPAAAERPQRFLHGGLIERGGRADRRGGGRRSGGGKVLTDHTVKDRRGGAACPGVYALRTGGRTGAATRPGPPRRWAG